MKLIIALMLVCSVAFAQVGKSGSPKDGNKDSVGVALRQAQHDTVTVKLDERAVEFLKKKEESLQAFDAEVAKQREKMQAEYISAVHTMIALKGYDLDKIRWESFGYKNRRFTFLNK